MDRKGDCDGNVEAKRDGYDDQDRDGHGDVWGGGGRAIENGKELGRQGEEE